MRDTAIRIENAYLGYEPEEFIHAFGFKGKELSGVWQTAVLLEGEGERGLGLGVESVLWSDAAVFAAFGEEKSNALMLSVTQYAVELVRGRSFPSAHDVVKGIFDDCYAYACRITGMRVTETFVLNALVPLDFAAYMLWARKNGVESFDEIFKGTARSEMLANIPLVTYGTDVESVRAMASEGTAIFKIKIGSDPVSDGDPEKMLAWDKERMLTLHRVLKDVPCPYTECGHPVYYFDANGRYDSRERLCELLSFMEREGILSRTVLFEEPFDAENKICVGDLPVCFAADESAHSLKDVKERIALGYKAITLKPIAKTISVTVDMAQYALSHGVQCFCADLTVNPVMVEWNKSFAARIPPIKGMKIGIMESNGAQNYVNWDRMLTYLPAVGGATDSVFPYRDDFPHFEIPTHYLSLIQRDKT